MEPLFKKKYDAQEKSADIIEHNVVAAIIRRALQDAEVVEAQNGWARTCKKYRAEARSWIRSNAETPFSLVWCCNTVAPGKADEIISHIRSQLKKAMILGAIALGITSTAAAQVPLDFTPRPIQVFHPGQERECELHWLHDLTILRQWQQEAAYWRAKYNAYAEVLGYGPELDTGNPTLNSYEVSENLIQEEFQDPARYYPTFIAACNAHIEAAHVTEYQFALAVWISRTFTCHARNTLAARGLLDYLPCDQRFAAKFPYEFIHRH